MKTVQLSFLLFLLLASCNDETETQAQLTAKKLQADITKTAISLQIVSVVSIYDDSTLFEGTTYVITSDGFITIFTNTGASLTLNLDELKSYMVTSSSVILYY